PFVAEEAHAVLHNILNRVPEPLSLPDISAEHMKQLQQILDRSLAKEVVQRYSKASEMTSDIEALIRKLKESGISEVTPIKERIKAAVPKLEDEQAREISAAPAPIVTPPDEETTYEGTIHLGRKSGPVLPPPSKTVTSSVAEKNIEQPRSYKMLAVAVAFIAILTAAFLFLKQSKSRAATRSNVVVSSNEQIDLGIAYSSDKKNWLESIIRDFQATAQGRNCNLQLFNMGYSEALRTILSGNEKIHVWWPTSLLQEELFKLEFQKKFGKPPVALKQELAMTSMVFVMWENRYNQFLEKYKKVSFTNLHKAMLETNGWADIAGKPDWGLFGFGYADPEQSNTGVMMLLLMAHEYYGKAGALTKKDIENPKFQEFVQSFRSKAKNLGASTELAIQEMILRGPATFDVAFVSENIAVDYLVQAEERWEKLRIIYPQYNMWNENPYYILDAPWVNEKQKQMASSFMEFVSQKKQQQKALHHGFRPAETTIPIKASGSPFLQYQDLGLQIEIGTTCEDPGADALVELLKVWKQSA
ncbi:substrate-binding domain-containing protein, partial [bacterium]|nr:substrate-binding domain-containing protein [bacterium]